MNWEKYSLLLDILEGVHSLKDISHELKCDVNTALVALYELKALGWADTKDVENWFITDHGSQAKKLIFKEKIPKIKIESKNINIALTFPREFGDMSKYFPNFVETSRIFKNELRTLEKGDEVFILTYSVDFKVLSQILEDVDVISSGMEKDFVCRIQYFHGFNEDEIEKIKKSGFNVYLNKIKMAGPGHPHAKMIVFKKKNGKSMLISSANLTDNVFTARNLEVGMFIKEPTLVNELERLYLWLWEKTSFG